MFPQIKPHRRWSQNLKLKKTKEINPERDRGGDRDWERTHKKQQIKGSPKFKIIGLSAIGCKNHFK